MTLHDLMRLRPRALRELLEGGYPIDASALDDTEYDGVSLGQPAFVRAITWTKFKKVFHRDKATGELRGWNVAVHDDGLDAPWVDRIRGDRRVTYWHYDVRPGGGYRAPSGHGHGLILDYARPENSVHLRRIRDPLVALRAGSVDLLLGYSYVDVGRAFPTPTWFALRRGVPLVAIDG